MAYIYNVIEIVFLNDKKIVCLFLKKKIKITNEGF